MYCVKNGGAKSPPFLRLFLSPCYNPNMKRRSVEIRFGTLFRVLEWGKPTDRIDVITDVGKSSYFFSAKVLHDEEQKPFISPTGYGTGGPENFSEVVGQWSAEELEQAIKRGWALNGINEVPEKILAELNRRKSGKRRLKL